MKNILLTLWVIPFVVLCSAQDKVDSSQNKPDLTGTWELDQSKSKSDRGSIPYGSVRLIITHTEPELKIMRRGNANGKNYDNDSIFYTDNRGETNTSVFQTALNIGGARQDPPKSDELESKTKWEGNKLVSQSSITYVVSGYSFIVNQTVSRELSTDGKILTITTTMNSAAGGRGMIKEVFNRVP
jgi:hypothetical protein